MLEDLKNLRDENEKLKRLLEKKEYCIKVMTAKLAKAKREALENGYAARAARKALELEPWLMEIWEESQD